MWPNIHNLWFDNVFGLKVETVREIKHGLTEEKVDALFSGGHMALPRKGKDRYIVDRQSRLKRHLAIKNGKIEKYTNIDGEDNIHYYLIIRSLIY